MLLGIELTVNLCYQTGVKSCTFWTFRYSLVVLDDSEDMLLQNRIGDFVDLQVARILGGKKSLSLLIT